MFDLQEMRRIRAFEHSTAPPFQPSNIDTSASIATYGDVRAMPSTGTTSQAMLTDDRIVQRQWERTLDVLGFRSGQYQLQAHLCSTGQPLTTAATPTKTTQSKILGALAGGYSAAGGSTVAAGSTATSLVVASGHGARFPVGSLVAVQYTAGLQIAAVTAVAVDTLTVEGLSGAPTTGNAVYNSQLIYPGDDPGTTIDLCVEHPDRNNIFWFFGGAGGLEFSMELGAIPTWQSQLTFAEWKRNADAATPFAGAFAAASFDGGQPFGYVTGQLLVGDSPTPTYATQHYSAFAFTTGITYEPIPTPDGVNGIHSMRQRRTEAPTVTWTVPFGGTAEAARWQQRAARSLQKARFRLGDTAGSMLVLDMPRIQITDVQEEVSSGVSGVKITAKLLEDTNVATQLSRAPWRLGQF